MSTKLLLLVFLIFLQIPVTQATATEKIGTVDLISAVALHPMMSLFDFERKGFFKVPLGLSPEDWNREVQKNKVLDPKKREQLESNMKKLDSEISKLEAKRAEILKGGGAPINSALQAELATITFQIEKLSQEKQIFQYEFDFPELTSPRETKEILERIEKEVLEKIEEIAEEEGISVVLNNSIPNTCSWPAENETQILSGKGISFLESSVYYSFLAQKKPKANEEQTPFPEVQEFLTCLDSIRHPRVISRLPLHPHPLVLRGGINLTPKIVRKILEKYRCNPESIFIIEDLLTSRGK